MTVRTVTHGTVLVVCIDRPQVRNAIDEPTARAIGAAMEDLDSRDDLSAAVLTGAGGYFCAGMDLKAFLAGQRPAVPGRGFAGIVERPPDKPIVAAVEGPAVAGGFEIALACDLIVAAETASFGLPEVRRGLMAAGGGLLRLPHRVPYHLAMEWILTGASVDAPTAYRAGLVNRLVPQGESLDCALRLAEAVAANGPLAVRESKRVVIESAGWPADEAFDRQRAIYAKVRGSADAREGALAFTEKRPPVWRGR
ncbi:crotonase/enoyl-CoA hydratase family protein [Dactylosporangium sp. NPDC005572]|uniref:crotonase/enoyl-CoA hydratase family protein n=1 Tax=Dactylosporangium sp. NPDC005572 TaxID=3156889 RepID=UPI0033BE354B